MTAHRTDPSESAETERAAETDERGSPMGGASTRRTYGRTETTALVAGGLLLARALKTVARNRRRALLQGVVGAALVGLGLRRARSDEEPPEPQRFGSGRDDRPRQKTGAGETLDEERTDEAAETVAERGGTEVGTEASPRGTDDEPAKVDRSEASMADEASEATGPTPEQGQPAQTEETEPDEERSETDGDAT